MVMVENATDPHDCFNTEIFLDRDRLIKPALNGQSDTASQISGIIESLLKSKVEDKSQIPNNTFKDESKALGESYALSGGSSKGTFDNITKGASTEKMAIPHLQ